MKINITQDTHTHTCQNGPNEKTTTGNVGENLEQLELLDTDNGKSGDNQFGKLFAYTG